MSASQEQLMADDVEDIRIGISDQRMRIVSNNFSIKYKKFQPYTNLAQTRGNVVFGY